MKRKHSIEKVIVDNIVVIIMVIIIIEFCVSKIIINPTEEVTLSEIGSAEAGDFVLFGEYEQDDDISTKDPIVWVVLENKDGMLFLLSKDIIELKQYDEEDVGYIKWKDSSLRNWLNSEFYEQAFSEEEKEKICSVNDDRVLLLNHEDVECYLKNSNLFWGIPSKFVLEKGIHVDIETNASSWWIIKYEYAGSVEGDGMVAGREKGGCSMAPEGVRPCIWLEIQ